MAEIFINYRRIDSAPEAKRIYTLLTQKLGGADAVFMDLSGIEPGDDFQKTILARISSARVMLTIIGRNWCFVTGTDGRLRLHEPNDLVRREILTAIDQGLRVIPVLVAGAVMPGASELPSALTPLTRLNAISIGVETFDHDVQHLAEYIQQHSEPSGGSVAKVCMVGAEGVGKTSLVRNFVRSPFSESYLTTLGVHISKREMILGDRHLSLQLWDLAGETKLHTIKPINLANAKGLIFVADGRASALATALDLRERFRDLADQIPVVLAANKIDIYETWEYTIEDLENTGMVTFTTSAKTGKAVPELFQHLARKIMGI
jgi:small GTP-binding protein